MKNKTPLRAIREKCLDCCVGQPAEVARCHIEKCPLWTFRDGHNPNRKGVGGKGNPEIGNLRKSILNGEIIENDD